LKIIWGTVQIRAKPRSSGSWIHCCEELSTFRRVQGLSQGTTYMWMCNWTVKYKDTVIVIVIMLCVEVSYSIYWNLNQICLIFYFRVEVWLDCFIKSLRHSLSLKDCLTMKSPRMVRYIYFILKNSLEIYWKNLVLRQWISAKQDYDL